MIFLLCYLGGMLTIFSPCVLPVLPFIFARTDQPFHRHALPVLFGMAATFTLLAGFATAGGAGLISVNRYGRYAAMLLLLLLGIALIFPALSERLMRPFVALGGRLQQRADQKGPGGGLLLGVAIGFLWAPCAGPILGLVLAGAALNGANLYSAMLLFSFAAGAATSLAIALLAGSRIYKLLKRGLGAEEWLKRGLGLAVVAGVMVIALGWDTRLLSRFDFLNTAGTEHKLIAKLDKPKVIARADTMPALSGAAQWLNSHELDAGALRGKVVLVDFWTYSCINCLRTLPYLKAWNEKYRDRGLVIIGVHTPEFAFERDTRNVAQAVQDLGITYPVALDNRYAIWNAFRNQYWPAHYLIDAKGVMRDHHFGEGGYDETEKMIRVLLSEAGHPVADLHPVQVSGIGATAAADEAPRSHETYLGYAKQQGLASPEEIEEDDAAHYTAPQKLMLDSWALSGKWLISEESAELKKAGGFISYHFRGRDLHLVMGSDKALRIRVTLDGKAPGEDHGSDIDPEGYGVIHEKRLYQLIRQNGKASDRVFRIQFFGQGATAYAFTFG